MSKTCKGFHGGCMQQYFILTPKLFKNVKKRQCFASFAAMRVVVLCMSLIHATLLPSQAERACCETPPPSHADGLTFSLNPSRFCMFPHFLNALILIRATRLLRMHPDCLQHALLLGSWRGGDFGSGRQCSSVAEDDPPRLGTPALLPGPGTLFFFELVLAAVFRAWGIDESSRGTFGDFCAVGAVRCPSPSSSGRWRRGGFLTTSAPRGQTTASRASCNTANTTPCRVPSAPCESQVLKSPPSTHASPSPAHTHTHTRPAKTHARTYACVRQHMECSFPSRGNKSRKRRTTALRWRRYR